MPARRVRDRIGYSIRVGVRVTGRTDDVLALTVPVDDRVALRQVPLTVRDQVRLAVVAVLPASSSVTWCSAHDAYAPPDYSEQSVDITVKSHTTPVDLRRWQWLFAP